MGDAQGHRAKGKMFLVCLRKEAPVVQIDREEIETVAKLFCVLLGPVGFWKPWENFNKSTVIGQGLKLRDQLIDQCNKPG